MSAREALAGPRTEQSPFRLPSAGGRFRSTRTRGPGEVNLKSAGLLHPRAADVHRRTLDELDPADILTYPVLRSTYAMLAERLDVPASWLVLTAGSDPGLSLLTRAFPAATRIVLHTPYYDSWEKFSHIAGCALDTVRPHAGTGRFVLDDLAARLRQGPPAFVVVTQPHSFTGQLHTAAELGALADTVAEHGSLLVVDTAYLAFAEGGEDTVRDVTGRPHVVRVNSFSKSYGLSGARAAVLVTHPATAEHLFDIDPESPVSGVTLALLRSALAQHTVFEEIWAEVRMLRERFAREIEEMLPGWRSRAGAGNFVTWDVPDPAQAAGATAYLREHGYVVRDVSGRPGLPAAVRISVTDEPNARQVSRLLSAWRQARSLP
ncbi:aminotransferase class I/II-fold pyridoxal phosphate-dependent enzyme [Streptomyces sp. NPDC015144]|uniref:aminotransferase class I/II-fold pyridoxal phosphate-dependent enzyme n=1 Tax=Streptomyces sp. NPDC015144 TaxID=3364944 RepID=UPI0037008518